MGVVRWYFGGLSKVLSSRAAERREHWGDKERVPGIHEDARRLDLALADMQDALADSFGRVGRR